MEAAQVKIEHFSDVLCVWAYVGQIRVDELESTFGAEVAVQYHFLDVFGDARGKVEARWRGRGGVEAYAAHVNRSIEKFDHVSVHPDVWTRRAPTSSMGCHVFLRAVGLVEQEQGPANGFRDALWLARESFFRNAVDVSSRIAQYEIAEKLGVSTTAIAAHIDSGRAYAALARDHELGREHNVKMSPTIVLDDGRQLLCGNVGYRVIEANIRELLRRPPHEASWC